ncbi:hypothetical protein VTK26DRAFT_5595 [Humicola hyalothermophila]
MSHGPPLPAGLLGFGIPMNMLQINTDPSDQISFMDDSFFDPFDGTLSVSSAPHNLLPQSFVPGPEPVQSASRTALPSGTEHTPFSSDGGVGNIFGNTGPGTGTNTGTSNPQQDRPVSGNPSNASTLTEFTKRRNWPAKIIEELQDVLHILDPNGRIMSISPSVERLTDYKPAELRDAMMRDLLHPDDVGLFTSELNESMASGTPFRMFYRMRRRHGTFVVLEAVGHAHIAAPKFAPNPDNQTAFCQAVFMMARPYPTKQAALLDSFLEHKMENERLKRKLAELQREQDEADEAEQTWQQDTGFPGTIPLISPLHARHTSSEMESPTATTTTTTTGTTSPATEFVPRRPSLAGTRSVSASSSRADTIEMLTGLRYQEGERSRGLTTGNPSATLVTTDVLDRDRDRIDRAGGDKDRDREREERPGEKKRKVKVKGAEEYVCTDCGTLESPEWRKGPSGPKTLCNACGLRWAKKEKKEKQRSAQGGGSAGFEQQQQQQQQQQFSQGVAE